MSNVPNVPGVPPLSSFAATTLVLLTVDALLSTLQFEPPAWGVYLDGAPALPEANSVLSFDYRQDWSIADYPVEGGGFQSYDKVQHPFESRVRITSGSSPAARQALLDALDVVANSLELYDIVTPEKVYTSVNVSHCDLHRTATNGVGVLIVDVWFQEIREGATTQFSNAQQPAQSGQQNIGTVQPQPTVPGTAAGISVKTLG